MSWVEVLEGLGVPYIHDFIGREPLSVWRVPHSEQGKSKRIVQSLPASRVNFAKVSLSVRFILSTVLNFGDGKHNAVTN